MSEKFEREERYIVFKVKDLSEHKLGWVRDVIRLNDIPTVDAVVVEADWPEYEPTWSAIERRVTGGEWNGEGLPPVGTLVEASFACEDFEKWHDGVCVAVGEDPEGREEFCVVQCGKKIAMYRDEAKRVRPRRSPEQIAADERTKAIHELVKVTCISRGEAARIYDAGYRKQVAP
ncbi:MULTISPECIES: hypothetical protein [Pseudomonas]|uniref:Uncharacterized protein n=1 Tax=Pseudomonas juntendi TaxID=2666183 RepID=A0ABZ2J7G1_9PSED|nr:hypothetical protein [Pseudomonas sp. BJP69]QDR69269.1 hypothetical protein FPB55_17365 [Pseudomonas sp. BJP69]WHL27812.1 hypothetical protein QJS63_26535 [Pseudomonas juntendi]WHL28139.1 hypothetical protein QJS63_00015 [Pseudomonas juntendi]